MSVEAARAFLNQVKSDEKLREQVSSTKSDNSEESIVKVVEIGLAAGFTFSAEEIQQVTSELSEEQLDEAAGGWSWIWSGTPTIKTHAEPEHGIAEPEHGIAEPEHG